MCTLPGVGSRRTSKEIEKQKSRLTEFYNDSKKGADGVEKYSKLFWENTEWRKSTFLKVKVSKDSAVLEIYREQASEACNHSMNV
jgi:hypothetical protein